MESAGRPSADILRGLAEASSDAKITAIQAELRLQAERPPAQDHRIAAFSEALLQALSDTPVRSFYEFVLGHRRQLSPSYGVNLSLRAFQKQLLRHAQQWDYPKAFTEPQAWYDSFHYFLDEARPPADEITFDLCIRDAQSNVSERYKSLKLIGNIFAARLGPKPTVLDIGCSQNLGLKRLAANLPFAPLKGSAAIFEPEAEKSFAGDSQLNDRLNNLLSSEFALAHGVGVDIWPKADPLVREWAKSCSFYPSELLQRQLLKSYERLEALDDPAVSFAHLDFAEPLPDAAGRTARRGLGLPRYELVCFSTVLYQQNRQQLETMLANARLLVAEHGLIVVQDFARLDRLRPGRLVFEQSWFAQHYPYRTFVYDPTQPEAGFSELMRWQNGRCEKVALNASHPAIKSFMEQSA